MRRTSFMPIGLLAVFLIILTAQSVPAANRLELPRGVHYHRFAAIVEGPEVSWINPAALGYSRTIAAQITGEIYESKFAKSWGFSTVGDGIGISYRHLDNPNGDDYNEYIFGAGLRTGHGVYAGASYRYFKDGPYSWDGTHFWKVALMVRQNPRVSVCAVLSNLNRQKIDGSKTDIEQLYSLSYRAGRYIALSTEVSLSTEMSMSGADYIFGVDIYAIPGLQGYINFDNNENYELGFRVNLMRYFLGAQSRLKTGGEHRGTSLSAGIVSTPQPSVIGRRGKY
ncbi:MAG: hypothetical protein DRP46_03515 [Candidatus Zixiibacteriota bacterium]|nr:MAG: hypothetical protein DRP46_03515 [candidate division Zixibacteria bacterium]HDL02692.1 hypothetical protein [candidate division Zixibacteria bacterium]